MPRAAPDHLNDQVFINCPFDDAYRPLFEAIVFAVLACGYKCRCALEVTDSGALRLDTLRAMIAECDRGVHDLSRVELSEKTGTPRFNMPFEFGVAVGARAFGGTRQRRKLALVLARKREDWHPTVSDLSGIDPEFHADNPAQAVTAVRKFLKRTPRGKLLPGAEMIWRSYETFRKELPRLARKSDHTLREALEYDSYIYFVWQYLDETGTG